MSTTVRLKDVAREAGVSTMTVSRALRLDPKVAPRLQKRIETIAARLGYRPNPLVSALMSYRRAGKPVHHDLKLGFLTCFPTQDGWRKHRLYREFYEGAALGVDRHGYGLEEFWLSEPGMTPERLVQVLATRNIPGVLLAPLAVSVGSLGMQINSLAAVAFGHSIIDPALHRVSNNQFRSMRQLLEHLMEAGYTRPGLALPKSLDDRVLHQWLGAFMVEWATPQNPELPVFLPPDDKWNREGFEHWLAKHRPDVVVAQHDKVLHWLRESGRRVPEDIGFAHLDCPSLHGPLSGVYQNGREIGIAAADMLVDVLHRNERGIPPFPRTMLIEGAWVRGTTICPQPLRAEHAAQKFSPRVK